MWDDLTTNYNKAKSPSLVSQPIMLYACEPYYVTEALVLEAALSADSASVLHDRTKNSAYVFKAVTCCCITLPVV